MPINWKNTAISIVDKTLQPPVVERVDKLLKLNYKIGYQTWPFSTNVGVPLPSTQLWEGDFGGARLQAEYGLGATLKLLDEIIDALQPATVGPKICSCSSDDLFWRGCRC